MTKKSKSSFLFKYLVLTFLVIFQSAFLLALCSNNILIAGEIYSNYRLATDSTTTSSGSNSTISSGGGSMTTAPDSTSGVSSGGSAAASLPIEITWVEAFQPPLSGDHNVSVHLNQAVDRVDFTVSGPQFQTTSGIQDSLTDWHFFWATSKMTDGYYTVTAYAVKGDIKVAKSFSIDVKNNNLAPTDSASVSSQNTSASVLTITLIEALTPPISGNQRITVSSGNLIADRVEFLVSGLTSKIYQGTLEPSGHYYFIWPTAEFVDGQYNLTATAYKDGQTASKSFSIAIKNTATTITPTTTTSTVPATANTIIKQPIINTTTQQPTANIITQQPLDSGAVLTEECKTKNITTAEACKNYLSLAPECRDKGLTTSEQCNNYLTIPPDCRQKGITNLEECWKAMSAVIAKQPVTDIMPDCQKQGIITYEACRAYMSMPPECRQQGLNQADCNSYMSMPPECREKNLTTKEECDKYLAIPPDCRQQGILDQEECKKFMYKYAMPAECQQAGANTQGQCAQLIFNISLPAECRDKGITGRQECNNYLMIPRECRSQGINNRAECDKYLPTSFMPIECRNQGISSLEECNYFMRNKFKAEDFKGFQPLETKADEFFRCQEVNITDAAECAKFLAKTRLPEDCQTAGATTAAECNIILFKKDGPKECIEAKIYNPTDCEKYIFERNAPSDCLAAGIKTAEACKKYMFEKYGSKEKIPVDKYPVECQKAGVKTLEECDKLIKIIYLPEECKKNKIIDEKVCEAYLFKLRLPVECREQNSKTREECDKAMFKKYGPPECSAVGITNEQECQDFMFNKYSPQVQCLGQDDWQCNNAIKDRYLGNIVAKQTQYQEFKDKLAQLTGESTSLKKIKEEFKSSGELVSLKNDAAGLKVLAAREALVIDEADNLIQSPPVALMIDSDQDGLPDDLEKRWGTNPDNEDTDGDGYLDGAEFANGYNPVGLGKLREELAPIDQAIARNEVLGQPKTEGELAPEMTINQVANANNQEVKAGYYEFSGQAQPGSVITLYLYSDIPVVVTVKTDEYGNWKYNFKEPLADGEHEIYLAVNDNTGKVVAKSSPLSFFIKEAKAVSVSDFVAPASPSQTPEAKSLLIYYVIAGIAIAIGLFLFLLFIKQKKSFKL